MTEEARFYMLFPFVVAALALLPSLAARVVFLLLAIVVAWLCQFTWLVSQMAPGAAVQFYFYFGFFLAGMLTCLLYIRAARDWAGKPIFGIVGAAIIAFIFVSSDAVVGGAFPGATFSLNGWHQPEFWRVLFGVLLFSVALYQRPFATWPMRHVGLLSYKL